MPEKITHKAFTLVELVLVLVILGIFAVSSYSAVYRHFMTSVIDSELRTVVSNLQRARQRAIGNTTDVDYSVKFLSDRYVLFPGTTYSSSGSNNEVFMLDSSVVVSTTYTNDVISFTKFNGRLTAGGTVYLSAGGQTKQIILNQLGIVEDVI